MRPQDTPDPQPTVHVPQRDGYSLVSSRPTPASAQGATANLARQQIDAIYSNDPNAMMTVETEPDTPPTIKPDPAPPVKPTPAAPAPASEQSRRFNDRIVTPPSQAKSSIEAQLEASIKAQEQTPQNPYERTLDDRSLQASAANWQQYHSAWQQYYQQYFHRYYSAEVQRAQAMQSTNQQSSSDSPAPLSQEKAMTDIRSRLRAQVEQRAKKVRASRHFLPIMSALGVMLVFAFLQYNQLLFSSIHAYVTPGNIEPANIIVDPNVRSAVGPDPLLVIPKINVQVPVVWNTTPDHASQMKAMENGVAWFGIPGANSKPGQIGNTVLSGHSSNDFFETGDYKFVFAPLEKLGPDDTIEIHYKGTLYTYVVTKKEIVLPTEVDKLIYDTDKPMLTLITCTPLGTALKRLLITAEQVSPNPANAKAAPSQGGQGGSAEMPGSEPTILERAFGR